MLPLNKQVAPLELCQKLDELGCHQNSYFHWTFAEVDYGPGGLEKKWIVTNIDNAQWIIDSMGSTTYGTAEKMLIKSIASEGCSAYTASELYEMLPSEIGKYKLVIEPGFGCNVSYVYWDKPEMFMFGIYTKETKRVLLRSKNSKGDKTECWSNGQTLAEALAKILLCLIENKYIIASAIETNRGVPWKLDISEND